MLPVQIQSAELQISLGIMISLYIFCINGVSLLIYKSQQVKIMMSKCHEKQHFYISVLFHRLCCCSEKSLDLSLTSWRKKGHLTYLNHHFSFNFRSFPEHLSCSLDRNSEALLLLFFLFQWDGVRAFLFPGFQNVFLWFRFGFYYWKVTAFIGPNIPHGL